MTDRLTRAQRALLAEAAGRPLAASTLRSHSELRWLEYLGLVKLDDSGRFVATTAGAERSSHESADSQIDG